MKISYLSWGSLLWNNDELKLKKPWKKTDLRLPLNFSRVSDNGKGRLTLVIDNENGVPNPTYIAPTKYTDLNLAIKSLKDRENTISDNIGYVNLVNNLSRSHVLTNKQIDEIIKLAKKENYDAIVWTDLPPNFPKVFGKKFSKDLAMNYILSKKNEKKLFTKIIEYIFLSKIYGDIKTPISSDAMEKIICKL